MLRVATSCGLDVQVAHDKLPLLTTVRGDGREVFETNFLTKESSSVYRTSEHSDEAAVQVVSACASPEGNYLAFMCETGELRLLDVANRMLHARTQLTGRTNQQLRNFISQMSSSHLIVPCSRSSVRVLDLNLETIGEIPVACGNEHLEGVRFLASTDEKQPKLLFWTRHRVVCVQLRDSKLNLNSANSASFKERGLDLGDVGMQSQEIVAAARVLTAHSDQLQPNPTLSFNEAKPAAGRQHRLKQQLHAWPLWSATSEDIQGGEIVGCTVGVDENGKQVLLMATQRAKESWVLLLSPGGRMMLAEQVPEIAAITGATAPLMPASGSFFVVSSNGDIHELSSTLRRLSVMQCPELALALRRESWRWPLCCAKTVTDRHRGLRYLVVTNAGGVAAVAQLKTGLGDLEAHAANVCTVGRTFVPYRTVSGAVARTSYAATWLRAGRSFVTFDEFSKSLALWRVKESLKCLRHIALPPMHRQVTDIAAARCISSEYVCIGSTSGVALINVRTGQVAAQYASSGNTVQKISISDQGLLVVLFSDGAVSAFACRQDVIRFRTKVQNGNSKTQTRSSVPKKCVIALNDSMVLVSSGVQLKLYHAQASNTIEEFVLVDTVRVASVGKGDCVVSVSATKSEDSQMRSVVAITSNGALTQCPICTLGFVREKSSVVDVRRAGVAQLQSASTACSEGTISTIVVADSTCSVFGESGDILRSSVPAKSFSASQWDERRRFFATPTTSLRTSQTASYASTSLVRRKCKLLLVDVRAARLLASRVVDWTCAKLHQDEPVRAVLDKSGTMSLLQLPGTALTLLTQADLELEQPFNDSFASSQLQKNSDSARELAQLEDVDATSTGSESMFGISSASKSVQRSSGSDLAGEGEFERERFQTRLLQEEQDHTHLPKAPSSVVSDESNALSRQESNLSIEAMKTFEKKLENYGIDPVVKPLAPSRSGKTESEKEDESNRKDAETLEIEEEAQADEETAEPEVTNHEETEVEDIAEPREEAEKLASASGQGNDGSVVGEDTEIVDVTEVTSDNGSIER